MPRADAVGELVVATDGGIRRKKLDETVGVSVSTFPCSVFSVARDDWNNVGLVANPQRPDRIDHAQSQAIRVPIGSLPLTRRSELCSDLEANLLESSVLAHHRDASP
jgi:hypothetical protein